MIDYTSLALFIPTFFFVSITPGMCMTLALTLGMSVGLRRTMWMMAGELIGVVIVAVAAVIGVASIMLQYPQLFSVLKYCGGGYLIYIGIGMLRSKGKLSITKQNTSVKRSALFYQGLITAISNPKGWAFMVSLLPPFININYALAPQLFMLLLVIVITEFVSLMAYATGGKTLSSYLLKDNNVKLMNGLAGVLMVLVGIWLALS